MKSWSTPSLIILGCAVWLWSACASAPPTQQPEAIYTAAVQTMSMRLTLSAGETAVAALTEIAPQPSQAPATIPSVTPIITQKPNTALLPVLAGGVTALPCDAAVFVQDISISDNQPLAPGVTFVKTWRIRNAGSCTWTRDYSIIFADGDLLEAPQAVRLPKTVAPDETVDVSVSMRTPTIPGLYAGSWMLQNSTGLAFGVEPNCQEALWVRIQVMPLSSSVEYAFDLGTAYCAARWRSSAGSLACPGAASNPDGGAVLLIDPRLETGSEAGFALWLKPSSEVEGWITGEYPVYQIQDHDHFLADIGCLDNNPDCDLLFRLDYRSANGVLWNLGAWEETYDDLTTGIDIDLSPLVGEKVQFVLGVTNRGEWQAANGVWFLPRIKNQAPAVDQVLIWRMEGGPQGACSDLGIFLTGRKAATARAHSCAGLGKDLGQANLSGAQLTQLLTWIDRFSFFDAEVYNTTSGSAEQAYLVFKGRGHQEAFNQDIENINAFAVGLYRQITR